MGPVPPRRAIIWTIKRLLSVEHRQRIRLAIDHARRRASSLQNGIPSCPSNIWVELTNRCNLDCLMCRRADLQRPLADLQWPLLKKVAEEVAEWGVCRIKLNRFGEPLLHPDIHRMTAFLKSRGVPWIFFTTNATLLDAEAREAIMQSGLDLLVVSIDGHTAATYERIRRGAHFEDVCRNVEELILLRNACRRKSPLVQVNAVLMQENRHELPELLRYWDRRADFVNILSYTSAAPDEHTVLDDSISAGRLVPCDFITSSMSILANGDVTVCCADYNGDLRVGNIGNESLRDIWKGERYQRIRALQTEGRFEELALCGSCLFTQQARRQALFRQSYEVYRASQKG